MIVPTYKCGYCGEERKPTIDTTGEMPVGMMALCDCAESREAWETEHRAVMERRKVAAREQNPLKRSIIHTGRVAQPRGGLRYRSR